MQSSLRPPKDCKLMGKWIWTVGAAAAGHRQAVNGSGLGPVWVSGLDPPRGYGSFRLPGPTCCCTPHPGPVPGIDNELLMEDVFNCTAADKKDKDCWCPPSQTSVTSTKAVSSHGPQTSSKTPHTLETFSSPPSRQVEAGL
ncbi:hypothetical protein PFLUV_G00251890 [Perca fluviatilis]|uniref:Uncharacterized protein n=1 Tax=Perca fluviatilis TaxID=8168 RepID=A0A6A5DV42_PERFL|nr:hypothetical protein PFLUV_G00251890 [Perca fluviatilis]